MAKVENNENTTLTYLVYCYKTLVYHYNTVTDLDRESNTIIPAYKYYWAGSVKNADWSRVAFLILITVGGICHWKLSFILYLLTIFTVEV